MYSKSAKVVIEFDREPQYFKLSVSDNGIGFDQNSITYGNRLTGLNKRANEICAVLEVLSDIKTGTTIKIIFNK